MKTKISAMGFSYAVNKDGATCRIVGIGTFGGTALRVPAALDGYRVVSIAQEAFRGCAGFTSVEIENGVTFIGAEAFAECVELTRVTIPDSVKEIGWGAFLDCASLSDISLGKGVTEIAAQAFCGCSGRAAIPAATVVVGEQAFRGFSEITVSQENRHYASVEGNLYTKDGKTLLQYATGKEETAFHMPDGVRAIGNFAFSGATRLAAVRFGEDLKIIGSNAFNGCTSLWAAILPDGLQTVEESAFYGCTALAAVSVAKGGPKIGLGAFRNCPKLSRIRHRDKSPLWKKLLLGKKRQPDSASREFKGKNWAFKIWF